MTDQPAPIRPSLPVGRIPVGPITAMDAYSFGAAVEAWLIGTKLLSVTTLLDAESGRQALVLAFDNPGGIGLLVRDRVEPGLSIQVLGRCHPQGIKYLTDAEVDAIVAAKCGPGEPGHDGATGPDPAAPQEGAG